MSVPSVFDLMQSGWSSLEAVKFREFLTKADAYCEQRAGLSMYDLPDWDYASAYESGQDPEEMVDELLEDNGFPS